MSAGTEFATACRWTAAAAAEMMAPFPNPSSDAPAGRARKDAAALQPVSLLPGRGAQAASNICGSLGCDVLRGVIGSTGLRQEL